MVTTPNQCGTAAPHEPHSWNGATSRYYCSGIQGYVSKPDFLAQGDFLDLGEASSEALDLMLKIMSSDVPKSDVTLQNIRIVIHEFWTQFLEAYAEYGPRTADELGLAGQWGDLHRKVKKLKAPLWEGNKERLTRETPRQVLMDIIGHALLAIDMIDREFEGGR